MSGYHEPLLEAKDPYALRPMPFLIGTSEFFSAEDVGIGELPTDSEGVCVCMCVRVCVCVCMCACVFGFGVCNVHTGDCNVCGMQVQCSMYTHYTLMSVCSFNNTKFM